jgi:Uma2 family endonuclease
MKPDTALRMVRERDGLSVDLQPLQGLWTEEQYLCLTDHTPYLVEFSDGVIDVLPMSTDGHQVLLALLYELFAHWLRPLGGKVLFAPLRLQIRPGKQREPDLLVLRDAADLRRSDRYWRGADMVVEVVSPDDPQRDTVTKVFDYAEAAIPEYWIVNPIDETVTVLTLEDGIYAGRRVYQRGDTAVSALLTGFSVEVSMLFDAR